MITPGDWIGIVGGGQLGRMMIHAASRMGYQTMVFCDHIDSPASHVANQSIVAPYDDLDAVTEFAKQCALVTFEFENIPYQTVQKLEKETLVRPNWQALFISQNRLREKQFVNGLGIETAEFTAVNSEQEFRDYVKAFDHSCILKTTELGYDGKGQYRIEKGTELGKIWSACDGKEMILEKMVPFVKEISVVAARGVNGDYVSFSPVENVHRNGILDTTHAPAAIDQQVGDAAVKCTQTMMNALDYIGMMAVEFFITDEGNLLVNEFAPRPHNSGHWTIDACCTDQFEQHIRAVCGMPLGDPTMRCKAEMKNLLGVESLEWDKYLNQPGTKLHLYGKKECKPGRKMGHVTKTKSW